jgi:hypothetical protein
MLLSLIIIGFMRMYVEGCECAFAFRRTAASRPQTKAPSFVARFFVLVRYSRSCGRRAKALVGGARSFDLAVDDHSAYVEASSERVEVLGDSSPSS